MYGRPGGRDRPLGAEHCCRLDRPGCAERRRRWPSGARPSRPAARCAAETCPSGCVDRGELGRREVVAVQAMPALDQVGQQQRGRVGPPVVRPRPDPAGRSVGRSTSPSPAPRSPVASSPDRSWITASRPSPATGDHAARAQALAVVAKIRDDGRRPRVDHPERGMQHVPALAVLQAQERTVGREPAAVVAGVVGSGHAQPVGASEQLLGGTAVDRHVHGEPVAIADGRGHHAGRLREPFVPRPAGCRPGRAGDRRPRTERRTTGRTRRPSRPATTARRRRPPSPIRPPPRRGGP